MFSSKNLKPILILFFSLSIITYTLYKLYTFYTQGTIYIAVVGPMSGDSEANGKAYVNGIKLYIDPINQMGGINGRKIELDIYDDENNPSLAEKKAGEIVQKGRAIAVIGHNSSACSNAGSPIYRSNSIPAITPASTNIELTKNNEWYYRVIFNDSSQGKFLGYYIKKILKKDQLIIITEDDVYGNYLTEILKRTSTEIQLSIPYQRSFQIQESTKLAQMKEIVRDLKSQNSKNMIFLAMSGANGAQFLKLIKDEGIPNQLIAPDSFASSGFLKALSGSKKEMENPGHYSNGLYVTTPLIFDNANQKAQYFKEVYTKTYASEPDWRAVYSYDSAMVLLEGIKDGDLTGNLKNLPDERVKLKDYLKSLDSSSRSLEGATGINFFEEGDSPKPVSIGIYKNKSIISALTQLQVIKDVEEIFDLEAALKSEKLLFYDNKYFYKTNVVYTGIEINEISDLSISNLTYNLDLYLWFRYAGDISPHDVEFINATTPVTLEKPIDVEYSKEDQMNYSLYHVRGTFKSNSLPVKYVLEQHALGVSFFHKTLTRDNLIYVIDTIGMSKYSNLKSDILKSKILSPSTGYRIDTEWSFQDILAKTTLGSPRYLNRNSPSIDFSRYNMGVRIKKDEVTLRRFLPSTLSLFLMVVSFIGLILLGILSSLKAYQKFSTSFWVIQTFLAYITLSSSEVQFIDGFIESNNITMVKITLSIYDLLWWIIPAITLTQSIEKFIWLPLEQKTDHKIPTVVRKFLNFIIYLLTIFSIIAFVYDQKITSLLATSGVVAMIIGLAIQVNIANVFSGIAINIERPFRVGDWVKIGNLEEGRVVDVTWRTTRLSTRAGIVLSVPNSVASEAPIHNFSLPDGVVEMWFTIHIDPSVPPRRVVKVLLDALMSSDGVLSKPAPYARFNEYNDWGADYLFGYCFKDYTKKNAVRKSVWSNVWTHLHRAGISPAFLKQDIHIFKGLKPDTEDAKTPLALVSEIDIFETFTPDEKKDLSQKIKPLEFQPGELIVTAGEQKFTMYVISEGVVTVQIPLEKGGFLEVARLGAGNFFGEMGLLTGAVRTANIVADSYTLVYEITKNQVDPFLEKHPEILRNVKKVMSQRADGLNTKKQEAMAAPTIKKLSIFARLKLKFYTLLGLEEEMEPPKPPEVML
jgi:potassium-dependent mechanosensitive channel